MDDPVGRAFLPVLRLVSQVWALRGPDPLLTLQVRGKHQQLPIVLL